MIGKTQRKSELCMVLQIILLQDHVNDFAYKTVNGIAGMTIEEKITFKKLTFFVF